VQELEQTLRTARPQGQSIAELNNNINNLTRRRDQLNNFVQEMHRTLDPSEQTPYKLIGGLVGVRSHGIEPFSQNLAIDGMLHWNSMQYRERVDLLEDVIAHLRQIGNPSEHPWRGVMINAILPTDTTQIAGRIETAIATLDNAINTASH